MTIDLTAVAERYHRALNAKPGKGDITEDGIAAITDSVADIPVLLDAINRALLQDDYRPEGVEIVMAQLRNLRAEVERMRTLIGEMADPDPCWFDHNGGCQAHGYLSLEPGQTCPMFDARQIANQGAGE